MVKARFNIPNDKVEEIEKLTQSVVNIISKLGGG